MTTADRHVPTSPEGSTAENHATDTQLDEESIPRAIAFTEHSLLEVPSDLSTGPPSPLQHNDEVDSRASDIQLPQSSSLNELRVMSMKELSEEAKHLSTLLHSTYAKSKRSSSASNDSSHERDRFRARFESFNPPKSAIIEDQHTNADSVCQECEEISSKTKKLNIEPLIASESIENLPPLDRDSPCFEDYMRVSDNTPTQILGLRMITPSQLSKVFLWYFNTPLPPTNVMFPWLHGLHPENFAQRSFFDSQPNQLSSVTSKKSLKCTKPDMARFVMCVETKSWSSKVKPKLLRNSVAAEEILQRIEFARSEVKSLVALLVAQSFSQKHYPHVDLSSLTKSIISDCLETGFMPSFVNSDPRRGVSLRNFHIQVNKVAACADFVVYCCENTHQEGKCKCMAFARLLKVAQSAEDAEKLFRYDVFLFDYPQDSISVYPELWTIRDNSYILAGSDSRKKTQLPFSAMAQLKLDTFNYWDADYQVKEKLETTTMSAATKLYLNVWSGNLWDHQIMMQYMKGDPDMQNEFRPEIIPLEVNKDKYCDPENSLFTKKIVDSSCPKMVCSLPPPRSHWQLFVHCHNDASFPSESWLNELLFKYTIASRKASEISEVHQLDFPSSGSIGFGDCRQDSLMSIVNTCKLLYLYSSSVAEDSLASLIYCSDGYTESSLLIFCFLMYAQDIPLETAMLKLHLDYGRPFYVFNSDVQVLRKLEVLLRKYSPTRLGDQINWSRGETISQQEINHILLRAKGRGNEDRDGIPRRLRLGYVASESSSDSDDDSDSESDHGQVESDATLEKNWVEDLEGSLPSRILPYVYLGSLKHANNLAVLSKLGISKVISVGESLDWLSKCTLQDSHEITTHILDDGNIEMIYITPKWSKSKKNTLYRQTCGISSVMKLNNLQDDGIDNLSKVLPAILEHIDEEYKQSKGRTKFLIHCRVGVSRSATVVIAEVMRRLSLSLSQAYLYVRVRRLNIVIQPNLRFMYELFKWEEMERSETKTPLRMRCSSDGYDLRVIDWFVMCQEIRKLNMPFIRV